MADEFKEDDEAEFADDLLEHMLPRYYDEVCEAKETLEAEVSGLTAMGLTATEKGCANDWAEANSIAGVDDVTGSGFVDESAVLSTR